MFNQEACACFLEFERFTPSCPVTKPIVNPFLTVFDLFTMCISQEEYDKIFVHELGPTCGAEDLEEGEGEE